MLSLVLYGTGTILGAGIFVVIGEVIGEAGPLAPVAYAGAALVAIFTGLSYSEIAARLPSAGGPIAYVSKAFGGRLLPGLVGWTLVVANLVSAATITTGFTSYLLSLLSVPNWLPTVLMVLLLGTVATIGMKQSAGFMAVTTSISLVALLVIIWLMRDGIAAWPQRFSETGGIGAPGAISAIMAGGFLAVYSFIGFGDVAQTAEEVRDVKRTLPRAMWLMLAIVFVLYLAISIALGGRADTDIIAEAQAPLVFAATGGEGILATVLTIVSLLVILDGALPQIVASSRLLMDLGRDQRAGAPKFLEQVNDRTHTPVYATVISLAIILFLALLVPLATLASATSLAILLVFIGVNASLWSLKLRSQPADVPDIWIGVPVIGVLLCSLTVFGQLALWLFA